MKILKEKFLQFSIHKQIQIGVIGFSCCVFLLVLGVIVVNLYLLFDHSHGDCMKLIEIEQNKQIDSSATFMDLELAMIQEFSKSGIQFIRNSLTNFQRNLDFINSFNSINSDKYIRPSNKTFSDCNLNDPFTRKNCLAFATFDNQYSQVDFNNYKKSLVLSFPLIEQSQNYREYKKVNQLLIELITVYSKRFSTYFLYPYSPINPKFKTKIDFDFTLNTLFTTMDTYVERSQIPLTININYSGNITDIKSTFFRNPLVDIIQKDLITAYDPNLYREKLSTSSFSYYSNVSLSTYNKTDYNTIDDIITGDWPTKFIELTSMFSLNKLKGIKLLASILSKSQSIVSLGTCLYFLRLFEIYNNYKNFTSNISYFNNYLYITGGNISSCFGNPLAFSIFNDFFYIKDSKIQSMPLYSRKVLIPILNTPNDSATLYGDYINFKVFRYSSPQITTKIHLSSNFDFYSPSFIYIVKDLRYENVFSHILLERLEGVFYLVMYVVIAFWYINILTIIIILYNVTSSITTPINKLIKLVLSIGKQTTKEEEKELDFDSIRFNDDKDIDELFQICKNLVKGGFTEEQNKYTKIQFISNVMNNISFIKTNNIIVHDKCLESLHGSNEMFEYVPKHKDTEEFHQERHLTTNTDHSNLSISLKLKIPNDNYTEREMLIPKNRENTTNSQNINSDREKTNSSQLNINSTFKGKHVIEMPKYGKFQSKLESDVYNILYEIQKKKEININKKKFNEMIKNSL